jgi:NADH-quinone oxidoreductase subunit N
VYLSTGRFGFPAADQVLANPLTLAGMVLIGMGIAFEMAVVPFHWGALDAYTAAAPGVAGFVMSASKLAAAFALGRVLLASGPPVAQVLVWIGCLTIAWGTFGAIAQAGNLRRMLAYSAVTHAGFIALAVGSGPSGPITAAFYAAVYGSMAMLVFAALSGTGVMPNLRRIGQLRAVALALGLFSLSGIPPTPGFWAKLAVLVVAWHSAGVVPTLIAVAGGVFSVLYYLRPLPDLFASLRGDEAPAPVEGAERVEAPAAGDMVVPGPRPVAVPGVLLATAAVVVLGLFPSLAWNLAR